MTERLLNIRPFIGSQSVTSPRAVTINLDGAATGSIREAVLAILKGAHLPTCYVDSIARDGSDLDDSRRVSRGSIVYDPNAFEEAFGLFRTEQRPSTDTRHPLNQVRKGPLIVNSDLATMNGRQCATVLYKREIR